MTKLTWGAAGERFFEAGVDRGVLYVPGLAGVSWNGLKAVKEAPTGGEPKPYYIDGFKYANIASAEEFQASIEAFSSPSEFSVCDGTVQLAVGLFVTQQPRKSFGLSYRTLIGDDLTGLGLGYKIHLVYNALAAPAGRDNSTMTQSLDPLELSWDISTRPPAAAFGYKPTAHLVIDSRKVDPDLLAVLEGYLYGANGLLPSLPTPAQIISQFTTWKSLALVEPLNFIGSLASAFTTITNEAVNPSFESVNPGTTIVRTNLSTNPRALAGNGWFRNNGAIHKDTFLTSGIPTHPLGITSALRSSLQDGQSKSAIASFYNIDTLANTGPQRHLGVWVLAEQDGFKVSTYGHLAETVLFSGVWTYIRTTGSGLAALEYATLEVTKIDGSMALTSDGVLVTGCVVEKTLDPIGGYFDGSILDSLGFDYGWTAAIGTSTSTAKAAIAEVRRNIVTNPNVSVDTTGWVSGVAMTRTEANGKWWVNAPGGTHTYAQFPGVVGRFYSIGMRVRGPVGVTVSLGNTDNVVGAFAGSASGVIPSSGEIVLQAKASVGTGGTSMAFGMQLPAGSTGIMITEAFAKEVFAIGILPGPYFDGTTIAGNDVFNLWGGLSNASISLQYTLMPFSTLSGNTAVLRSVDWSVNGYSSIRLKANQASSDSRVDIFSSEAIRATLKLNTTYTILATARLIAEQTGNLSGQARSIFVHLNGISQARPFSAQAPNAAGVYELSFKFTTLDSLAGYNVIRLYHGGVEGSVDIWWDKLMLVEGDYTAGYFDGAKDVIYKNQVVQTVWDGTPHQSTSSFKHFTELSANSQNGDANLMSNELWVFVDGVWQNKGLIPLGI